MVRIPTHCAQCISRCGCLAVVEDGRLVAVEPDPGHPTGHALCLKGRAAPELVHHPERLTHPLRRTRPKGDPDPGWRVVSWEEALEEAGERLRELGPRATTFAVATPSGTGMGDAFGWVHRLAHAFGSPDLLLATENCNWHKDITPTLTWGAGIGMPDYDRTGCALIWGFNPGVTWPAHARKIQEARRRGARLVVVDPRGTGLALQADLWLALRPGTDGALALGLIHLFLKKDRVDHAFLRAHSDAFDPAPVGRGTVLERLTERAAAFPPERVATLTGLRVEDLHRAVDLLTGYGPLSFFTWTGTCQQAQATQTTRALNILYALTGCLGAPGGNVWFARPPVADITGFGWVDPALREQTLGRSERPLGPPSRGWVSGPDFYQSLLEAPAGARRALVAFGGNPLVSRPDAAQGAAALRRLDFFVQTELFRTPSSAYADLLLPAASCWEREGLQAGFQVSPAAEAHVQLRPAVVPPPGEARSDVEIVFALAERLGLAEAFFGGSLEAGLAHQLAPTGLTPALLRGVPRGIGLLLETTFGPPAAKIRLWSEALAAVGQDPLPDHCETQAPDGFPYLLTCGKVLPYCHSQHRELSSLRRVAPEPEVELAPDVARGTGVADGDPVAVCTPTGRMEGRARIQPHLAAGTVWAQYGWWHGETPLSYNACADQGRPDPVAGSQALRGIPCTVNHRLGP